MEIASPNTIPDEAIIHKIFLVRGQKVMLDKDLAALYGVGTRDLNKAVKRNPKRFPEDFIFQLTQKEVEDLMFHSGTSSWGGRRKLLNAFTEQGIAMLSPDDQPFHMALFPLVPDPDHIHAGRQQPGVEPDFLIL
ncbi:MAG: ORF6N domain-containing protein [bacterium]